MKKRDFFLDYVIQKEFIEDLMKAFGWVTLSSAIYTVSIWALSNDAAITGLLVFALFLAVSTLSLMYVCLYVFLPLNDSIYPDDPYWDEEAQKLIGLSRWIAILKINIGKKRIPYLTMSLGFFFYGKLVANFLVSKLGA